MKKTVVLIVMDGIAYAAPSTTNAFSMAKKPHLDFLLQEFPNTTMDASGEAVGLPEGQMGNSEVGHMNLGAGRIVYQSLTRVNVAIKDGSFYQNKAYISAFEHTKQNHSNLHVFALLSDGGVHSHIRHIEEMFRFAKSQNVEHAFFHAFLDGRDVPPSSAKEYVKILETFFDEIQFGSIATVSGRYYAMDRDKNWDRIQLAYDNMTFGKGPKYDTATKGIQASYDAGIVDEFVEQSLIKEEGLIRDNDAIIFMNFRPDRAIQIGTAYSNPTAAVKLNTEGGPKNIHFVSTMKYADSVLGPIAFELNDLSNTFGDYLAKLGMKQLRIAETEKYAHVTFFFDGGVDKEIPGAKRVLVPSPKVATYDLLPQMSAVEVTDKVIEELETRNYDVVILNFANGDMVGHTGVVNAAIKAVETVDECVGRVVDKTLEIGGVAIITADHGNCEKMVDETGQPFTAHTTNPVPLIVTKKDIKLREGGSLGDIAPTMLELLSVPQPSEMTGKSLILHD